MKTLSDTHPDPAAARRISLTLFAGQGLGSAGFLVASTITPIVGAQLGGSDAWAGVPSAMYQGGVALAAIFWGRAMEALGRRPTLMMGMAAGTTGALVAGAAAASHRFVAFLAGILLMGVANSALQLGRFVSAEVHLPEQRGRAISRVVLGGTVGAVFGPFLAEPAGHLAKWAGLDPLAGPYGISAVLFVLVAVLFGFLLHPEPRELARRLAEHTAGPQATAESARRSLGQILADPLAAMAIFTMIVGQVVMVMLMVITAVHMSHHNHRLASISAVLSSHVFGMFAFSIVSGRLTDKFGRLPVIASGALLLLLACMTAPLSTAVWALAGALLLLGVGWNFCYVAGSSLLSDRLTPSERARTQGVNDFLIGSVSALGALTSGLVFARAGYTWMAVSGGVLSAILLLLSLGVLRHGAPLRVAGALLLALTGSACAVRGAPRLLPAAPAELWAPDVVSTPGAEVRITFSPDGRRMLWGTIDRPGGPGGWDIFESVRDGATWSTPRAVAFNSPANDFDPSFAPDGRGVYFFSNRDGGLGKDDLYFAAWDAARGVYGDARNLGPGINTPSDEWAPVVSPDGRRLMFATDGRGGFGKHDLFVCERTTGGWGPPRNLGAGINTDLEDFDATFLHDGQTLVLTSGNFEANDVRLYVARLGGSTRTVLGPEVNARDAWNLGPSISASEKGVLYFTSQRDDHRGRADIYRIRLATAP